jgi:hypothetical protein
MTVIVFEFPNGSKQVLKSSSKEVRSFIKDITHDLGAVKATIK